MPIPNIGNYIPVEDFDLSHAEKVISASYTTNGAPRTSASDTVIKVSVDNKRKDLLKFGRSVGGSIQGYLANVVTL